MKIYKGIVIALVSCGALTLAVNLTKFESGKTELENQIATIRNHVNKVKLLIDQQKYAEARNLNNQFDALYKNASKKMDKLIRLTDAFDASQNNLRNMELSNLSKKNMEISSLVDKHEKLQKRANMHVFNPALTPNDVSEILDLQNKSSYNPQEALQELNATQDTLQAEHSAVQNPTETQTERYTTKMELLNDIREFRIRAE